jgi:anti-sigma factor RsiW
MAAEQQRLTSAERANLVAHLDGELTEDESHAIASKLTQSVSARREVESLEKTWELLDYLPRPKAPDDFTAKTLTQVQSLEGKGDQMVEVAGKAARHLVRALVCAAVALLTLGIGYISTRWVWPDRTARLARDLSVAEHLKEYQEVGGSFEFLKGLDEMPSFNDMN